MNLSASRKFSLFLCYEMLRIAFIFTFRPEFDIDMLPASWYMATPLLILPILLVIFIRQDSRKEKKRAYGRTYAYSKFLSVAGFFPFMKAALLPAFEHAKLTGYYSLKRMGILLIFLVIDVILGLIFLLDKEKEEETQQDEGEAIHADNSNSQW